MSNWIVAVLFCVGLLAAGWAVENPSSAQPDDQDKDKGKGKKPDFRAATCRRPRRSPRSGWFASTYRVEGRVINPRATPFDALNSSMSRPTPSHERIVKIHKKPVTASCAADTGTNAAGRETRTQRR